MHARGGSFSSIAPGMALPLIGAVLFASLGCERARPPLPQPTERERRAAGRRETARFVERQLPLYQQVVERTLTYLGAFSIDPVALRREGIKGKKKLVELMDAYVSLHRHARGSRRAAIEQRFRAVAQVTARSDYHDLGAAPTKQFHQDATSYLRACYLMEKMGLDTKAYREEIGRIKPQLDAHLVRRGPHQRMAFKFYYAHFKLAAPPLLTTPFTESVTARRLPVEKVTLNMAYDLTHEVFVPYDYGGKLDVDFFSAPDRAYLRDVFEQLARRYIQQREVDILGEILASMRYLGDHDLPVYREGLELLLRSQRPNGSFGDYERHRARRGALLELDAYLHTTSVAMDILPLAFEGPADTR